jgi:hypothetical protein
MLGLFTDTSVWLDLAKRRDGQQIIVPLRVFKHQGLLELFVPSLVIDEFERNQPRAEAAVTASASPVGFQSRLLPCSFAHRTRLVDESHSARRGGGRCGGQVTRARIPGRSPRSAATCTARRGSSPLRSGCASPGISSPSGVRAVRCTRRFPLLQTGTGKRWR